MLCKKTQLYGGLPPVICSLFDLSFKLGELELMNPSEDFFVYVFFCSAGPITILSLLDGMPLHLHRISRLSNVEREGPSSVILIFFQNNIQRRPRDTAAVRRVQCVC